MKYQVYADMTALAVYDVEADSPEEAMRLIMQGKINYSFLADNNQTFIQSARVRDKDMNSIASYYREELKNMK